MLSEQEIAFSDDRPEVIMKIRFFSIDTSKLPELPPSLGEQSFRLPGLDAYALSYATLNYNGVSHPVDGNHFLIKESTLVSTKEQFERSDRLGLIIYYHGIRDYSALFPQVKANEPERAERIGRFYEEAEVSFDAGAWMSFMLMSGAIIEHLLFHKVMNSKINSLCRLTVEARRLDYINNDEKSLIDEIRASRNVIHCDRLDEEYISRKQAMDVRTLVEKLMLAI